MKNIGMDNVGQINRQAAAAKLLVMSKGKQRFLEAHRLNQWWADDLKLQQIVNDSKLISMQLKSLNSQQAPQQTQGKPQVTEIWLSFRVMYAI